MKMKIRIASFLLAAFMIFATVPGGAVVLANEAPTPNLGNYAGRLSGLIGDLTGWANDFEAYADSANLVVPIDMNLETFEGFLSRLYGYTSNLRAIHTSMGTHDLDILPFGDDWPGPRPPWSMVLMSAENVLLGGLGYGYEYLQGYIAEPFIAPTSEAVIYFIHEMNMGNPEESGFLGCVNCIRNLMFMLGHLGEMMDEQAAHQPEPPTPEEVVEPEPTPAQPVPVPAPAPEAVTANYFIHTVVASDSLYMLARTYLGAGNRWGQILELNRDLIRDPRLIQIGWQLRIPA